MSFTLNFKSVEAVFGKSQQLMVYGFQHCRYTQVAEALKESGSPIKKIFDCSIGFPGTIPAVLETVEGGKLEQIAIEPITDEIEPIWELKQYCKAGLVNLVFENFKRQKNGLPPITVLFCVDIDDNRHKLTPKSISSREYGLNNLVTMSELRRAYKLCCEFPDAEVRKVARDTFKFVKVQHVHDREFAIQKIDAPWQDKAWDAAWTARKKDSNPKPKKFPWRQQLELLVNTYRAKVAREGKAKEAVKEDKMSEVDRRKCFIKLLALLKTDIEKNNMVGPTLEAIDLQCGHNYRKLIEKSLWSVCRKLMDTSDAHFGKQKLIDPQFSPALKLKAIEHCFKEFQKSSNPVKK